MKRHASLLAAAITLAVGMLTPLAHAQPTSTQPTTTQPATTQPATTQPTTTQTTTPPTTQAPQATQAEQAQSGPLQTVDMNDIRCVVKDDHSVWCWRNPSPDSPLVSSIEGLGTEPQPIPNIKATKVATGGTAACFITTDQSIWCLGNQRTWGLKKAEPRLVPASKPIKVADGKAIDIEVTDFGMCAVEVGGAVRCWGDLTPEGTPNGQTVANLKAKSITYTPPSTFRESARVCALTDDGVSCWRPWNKIKQEVSMDVTAVTATGHFLCAVDTAGHPWCKGYNGDGQLGYDQPGESDTLRKVEKFDAQLTSIVSDRDSACGIDRTGTTWCWGAAPPEFIEKQDINYPEVPVSFTGQKVTELELYNGEACLITTNRELWCSDFQERSAWPENEVPRKQGLHKIMNL